MEKKMGADFKSATTDSEKKLFIETYGCQMNVADSEVIASVMQMAGYNMAETLDEADAVFMNTCSIRDNAEQKILNRLEFFHSLKKKRPHLIVGVLGCMAERVKDDLIAHHHVDLVVGPDAYLTLPELIASVEAGEKAINVELSTTETYRDVIPSRICGNHISGFVSIMRGCNNFCTYCIVPYTRGRERSRDVESILREVADLQQKGYKEVTLLGQNVNSYRFERPDGEVVTFPMLLRTVAQAAPSMRIRFTTSHPKDMSDETLHVIAEEPNVCRHIHLPVQSGSSRILKLMNRKYDREWYLERVAAIRRIIPDCGLSTDIFSGFHSETRPPAVAFADGGVCLRLRLHVQVQRAPRYLCLQAPARRHSRGGENPPSERNHRLAEPPLGRSQRPLCGQDLRGAGRGRVEAQPRPALRPHGAEPRGGVRPWYAPRGRLGDGAHHWLQLGHAVGRRSSSMNKLYK